MQLKTINSCLTDYLCGLFMCWVTDLHTLFPVIATVELSLGVRFACVTADGVFSIVCQSCNMKEGIFSQMRVK